ncbi:MAG: hypothetical protein RLZZ399_503 [Verrucomicrobiota bacterium]
MCFTNASRIHSRILNMNPRSDSDRELRELCERLLESRASQEDIEHLEFLVLHEPDARRFYVEYRHLHANLHQHASRLQNSSLSDVLAEFPGTRAKAEPARPGFGARPLLKIAAVLVIGLGAVALGIPGTEAMRSIASLEEAHQTKWDASSLPTEAGSRLKRGRLRLLEGFARVKFRSGAEVSLEGPVELELLGSNLCALHSGSIVAHVPESARGFEVQTQNARLIDHGTDFGISAETSGKAQVHILQGAVEIRHGRTGESVRLRTREAAEILPAALVRSSPSSPSEEELERPFLRQAEPVSSPHLERVNLSTASGLGAAAYVTSPDAHIHFSETLLLLKNSEKPAFLRKAFLKFDLAPIGSRKVSQAELVLHFESTGFGYPALTDRCQFAVYGLLNDAEDAWDASTLSWRNAPAYAPEGDRVAPTHTRLLGRFETPKGIVSGQFTLRSDALSSFLNEDTNRLASLIVVRETALSNQNSAVHGFAGNHHPTLPPPALRLLLSER